MADLGKQKGLGALALELTILTACRTSEVIKSKWPEIDLAKKIWTIPAERMKAGIEHRVPLSERAIGILKELKRHPDQSGYVFPGGKIRQPLSPDYSSGA